MIFDCSVSNISVIWYRCLKWQISTLILWYFVKTLLNTFNYNCPYKCRHISSTARSRNYRFSALLPRQLVPIVITVACDSHTSSACGALLSTDALIIAANRSSTARKPRRHEEPNELHHTNCMPTHSSRGGS